MPYTWYLTMIFIETSLFTKIIADFLTDDEYSGLQLFLIERPDAGQVIKGTGGVRKLRWSTRGRGKGGGIRVIYYWRVSEHEIWLLTAYSKSVRENIPAHVLRKIAEEISHD